MSAADSQWCRSLYSSMAEGGVWGVPRSGLVFRKQDGGLTLTQRMPYTPELALAATEGLDVPLSEAELRVYQDVDFRLIQERFKAAGIPVKNGLEE